MPDSLPTATFNDTLPKRAINYQPSGLGNDATRYLAPRAADRMRQLRQRAVDLHAVVPAFSEISEANVAKLDTQARVKRLTDHPQLGDFGLPKDDIRVVDAEKRLSLATDDLRRLTERAEARTAAWPAAAQTVGAVENWLRDGKPGNCVLEVIEIVEPKLQKGESVIDAIGRLRRRVRELRADAHRIQSSCYPSSHARAQMRRQVEALAARGAVSVSRLIEADSELEWPDKRYSVPVLAGSREAPVTAVAQWQQPDALAVLCWLCKDQLIKAIDLEIADSVDDAGALSPEARAKAEAE